MCVCVCACVFVCVCVVEMLKKSDLPMTALAIYIIHLTGSTVLTFYLHCSCLSFFCPFTFPRYYRVRAIRYRGNTAYNVPINAEIPVLAKTAVYITVSLSGSTYVGQKSTCTVRLWHGKKHCLRVRPKWTRVHTLAGGA